MSDIIYIILTILLLIIIVILAKYNRLVKLQNRVKKAQANIEIYLKKRFDLIPNIVECVTGYSKYENSTLQDIIALRNSYSKEEHLDINKASEMNNKLNKYLAIVEDYPELKANTQFLNLQDELSEIEDELERARRVYNDDVTNYNNLIQTVPSNFVASIFAFKKAELFKAQEEEKKNIKVKL